MPLNKIALNEPKKDGKMEIIEIACEKGKTDWIRLVNILMHEAGQKNDESEGKKAVEDAKKLGKEEKDEEYEISQED